MLTLILLLSRLELLRNSLAVVATLAFAAWMTEVERVGDGGGGGGDEGEEGGALTGVYGALAGDREGGFQIEEKQKKQRVWNGLKMIRRGICG